MNSVIEQIESLYQQMGKPQYGGAIAPLELAVLCAVLARQSVACPSWKRSRNPPPAKERFCDIDALQ